MAGEPIMLGPIRVLCAGATAFLVCGLGFLPMAAAAPKLSDADDAAIKSAITSCKAEAKAKKIRFPASRAFLRDCVTETIRNNPTKR
jgi:hypothetical protein